MRSRWTALTSWRGVGPGVGTGMIALLAAATPAAAVDLTVQSLEINQGVQFGSTQLIAGKTTMVRAKIGVTGSGAAVSGVDAVLRVFVNGVEHAASPVFSINGPIAAPLSPQMLSLNDTINFLFVSPVSNNVDFIVEVNPTQTVAETNYQNNELAVNNKVFFCRNTVELAYVPIFYAPMGTAPEPELLEPGIGDGFVRAIYSPGEWNYHRSPLPDLVWTQSINVSANALLNTLKDIRISQLPSAGYPQPPFLFGWLPGNPFSGNGSSLFSGGVAFGNTEIGRHQRTFAHELGHLVGLSHNLDVINTVGVDTEHHLWDTQELPQTFGPDKFDIMAAGLLTNQAFVNQNSYTTFINDSRILCPDSLLMPQPDWSPMLRVSGVITLASRDVQFDAVTRIALAAATSNDPRGDLLIAALDETGATLHEVAFLTGTSSQSCGGAGVEADPQSSFYLLVPESVAGKLVHEVTITDRGSGRLLGQRQRSPNSPQVQFTAISVDGIDMIKARGVDRPDADKGGQVLAGRINLSWAGTDPDGDPLLSTVHYSPDSEAWLPIAVNLAGASFDFQSTDIPASGLMQGRFRISVTDGLNHAETTTAGLTVGPGSPPDVYLLSPNHQTTHQQHAPIALHAAAWDMEDLMLADEDIAWSSSLNGELGHGHLLIVNHLSPGSHVLSVTGTDLDGRAASKQITLTVTPRQISNPDLNGDGQVNGLDLALLLGDWGLCPGVCPADLNFDNQVTGLDLALLLGSWG